MEFYNFANIPTPSFTNELLFNGKPFYDFGINNIYPQELLEISDKSVTHTACLEFKNLAIQGEGYTNLTPEADAWMKAQDYRTEFTTILNKIALSLSIFDGYAIQVIWDKSATKVTNMYFTNFDNVRVGKCDEWGIPQEYYLNDDWINYPTSYTPIKPFDMDKKAIKAAGGRQLLYIINKSGKSICYPNPRYASAINFIFAEYEMSVHQLSSIANGFSLSKIFTFIGNPSMEQREENKFRFDNAFRGSKNAGKVIVEYVETPDQKVQVTDLTPSTIVDQYTQAKTLAQSSILTAHGITSPALLGLSDGNQSIFSNGQELMAAYNVFFTNKIKPYHKLIEEGMNLVLEAAGFPNEQYKIVPYMPIQVDNTQNVQANNEIKK